jgi:hypothetical protein
MQYLFFSPAGCLWLIDRFDHAVLTVLCETIAFLHNVLFISLHKRITTLLNFTSIDQLQLQPPTHLP